MFESRFQSFAELGDPANGSTRVAALRAELANAGLAGFIVPRADEHQNEYAPPNAERLRWLSGFAGSAAAISSASVAVRFAIVASSKRIWTRLSPLMNPTRPLIIERPSSQEAG